LYIATINIHCLYDNHHKSRSLHPPYHHSLQLVLDNFLSVLPVEMTVYWYTYELSHRGADFSRPVPKKKADGTFFETHSIIDPGFASINSALQSGRLQVRKTDVPLTKDEYNRLLSTEWLWSRHAGKHVLLFERDTVLCGDSSKSLHDFAKHQFIGAPWSKGVDWCIPGKPCCCNSGLSLSNATAMLDFMTIYKETPAYSNMNWDGYIQQLVGKGHLTMPEERDAQSFSVESLWHGDQVPFGVHKPWWGHYSTPGDNLTNLVELEKKCPEVKKLCQYASKSRKHKNPRHGKSAQFFYKEICE
jgi:hypothetical protein